MSPCQVVVPVDPWSPKAHASAGVDHGQAGGFYVQSLGPFSGTQAVQGPSSNRGHFCRFACPKSQTISKVAFVVSSPASGDDPVDVGIYNKDGTVLLGSSGSRTGFLNSNGVKQVPFQAPVPLVAGTVYYAAWACSVVGTACNMPGVSAVIGLSNMFGVALGGVEIAFQSGAFPLPASLSISGVYTLFPIMALLQ
jgi:hypothetical protein